MAGADDDRVDALRRQATSTVTSVGFVKASNTAADAANSQLQARAGDAEALAKSDGSKIVAGALTGVPVVILGAPGATALALVLLVIGGIFSLIYLRALQLEDNPS